MLAVWNLLPSFKRFQKLQGCLKGPIYQSRSTCTSRENACTNCQPSCEAGSSFGRKQEWSPHSFLCGTLAMNSNFVYHAKNPVCARATNDPRIIRPRLLDGRKMAKQQLRLEELSEEGRQWPSTPNSSPSQRNSVEWNLLWHAWTS